MKYFVKHNLENDTVTIFNRSLPTLEGTEYPSEEVSTKLFDQIIDEGLKQRATQ